MNKGELMINIIEIRDNGLFIDGTKIKAYNNYGLSRASDEGYSRLVLDIPVIIKGLDDWQLEEEAAAKATAPSNEVSIDRIAKKLSLIIKREYGNQNMAQKRSIQFH